MFLQAPAGDGRVVAPSKVDVRAISTHSMVSADVLAGPPVWWLPVRPSDRMLLVPRAIDWSLTAQRVDESRRRMCARIGRIGVGVSHEAQMIFDALSKTMECAWADQTIRVLQGTDVTIAPPYVSASCSGTNSAALARVRKVVRICVRVVSYRIVSYLAHPPLPSKTCVITNKKTYLTLLASRQLDGERGRLRLPPQ